ncbi:MAG TPA: twin-arginine translocation signal domain-containing protein [Candidatus Rubneribacter avistercoris]|nr:twin-arginine translocation signal domain-containing protein [Candidatus Rubneribacter avistercoris]
MTGISRRDLLKGAAVSAASVSTLGLLAACSNEAQPAATASEEGTNTTDAGAASTDSNSEYVAEVLDPSSAPDAASASNFNVVPESETVVGTTYENLLTAIAGETGATTKYEAYSKVAEQEGFDVLARLFQCTADAEKIHIELEYNLAKEIDPATEKPEPPAVEEHESDINLISGANGEIYETSDMYPSFIKKAQEEGNNKAVQVFTRAKLAEAYHAKLYMDAYTTIDEPFDGKYYLCPICGYIHKGENFVACPICLAPKSSFTAY